MHSRGMYIRIFADFTKDPADLAVIALHVRLLRRAVGIAVEHADASRHLQRRVVDRVGSVFLDHFGVRELGAVVGEDDAEEFPEDAELPEECEASEETVLPETPEEPEEKELPEDRSIAIAVNRVDIVAELIIRAVEREIVESPSAVCDQLLGGSFNRKHQSIVDRCTKELYFSAYRSKLPRLPSPR